MQMVLWPLLVVNLRILGLTWWWTTYFVQNYRTTISPSGTRRTTGEVPDVGAKLGTSPVVRLIWRQIKLEAWRPKMFHNFHYFQSDMVFGIVKAFSWIFDAISSEKSYLTLPFLLLAYIEWRTVEFFPAYVTETNTHRAFLPFDTPSEKLFFFRSWAGLEPTSPWLLVMHAKPLHHQGYHAGNAAD